MSQMDFSTIEKTFELNEFKKDKTACVKNEYEFALSLSRYLIGCWVK
jgi:hypothetical protein